MKISVSAYSFNQAIKQGKMTQMDCIKKAKELGFSGIEFTEIDGAPDFDVQIENAKKLRKEAKRHDMEIVAYAIGAVLYQDTPEASKNEVDRLKHEVDIAKALGAPVMRHDVCYELGKSGNARSFDLMLPTIAENIRAVTEYAMQQGIRTCTENHGFIAQDSDRMERLFHAVNHDNYGLLVDIGNFLCVDENPITAVSKVAPYAIHAHAKDMIITKEPESGNAFMTRGGNYCEGCVIGEGVVPVAQCLRILKHAGYDGWISMEYEGKEECIEGIRRGMKCLNDCICDL